MSVLKLIYYKIVPVKIRGFLWDIRSSEQKKTFGSENAEKTFYLIGHNFNSKGGLFHIVYGATLHIHYALSKGYIPVIDLQNNPTQYLDHTPPGKENAWEYFFEQPCGIGLEQIKNSKNIVLCTPHYSPKGYYALCTVSNDTMRLFKSKAFKNIKECFTGYVKMNAQTLSYIESNYEKIIKDKRVCGVLARGTDYAMIKPKNHPIQPEVSDLTEKIKHVMQEYKCDIVYLATEDDSIYEKLKIEFGEKLVTNEQTRFRLTEKNDAENQYISDIHTGLEREKYQLGLDYLCSLYILSKAQCFVGGFNNGTIGVMLMTNGFEYAYVFDLGYYK